MSVIKVQNLSKRYRLGLKEKQADTLVGQISQIIRFPWDNLKRLRDLNRFGDEDESVFWALKDVSFEVKEGEVLGIIGKNGAGKSTLLKILSQITDPTSGKIEIRGRVASLLEVGTGFHPELSGRENIYMNGTILGMTRREIDSKLDEIIDFSGVEKFIDTPVKFYSSGMKVRLGFSVAAHLEPEILIIDEVLAVGDYEFQAKCLGKMEDVAVQGRTVLFVSHNMGAINSLTKRVILIDSGEISEDGIPDKIVKKYLSLNKNIPKIFGSNEFIEIIKIGIFEKDNFFENYNIGHDKEIQISCTINSKRNLERLILSLTLHSMELEKLSTIHIKPLSLKEGINKISFNLESGVLVPGNYFFNVHFHDMYSDYLIVERILDFSIFDNGSPFIRWEGVNIGKFFINYNNLYVE
tara:strand:+ start:1118 stop:2347 length:1230 start_codon:yes stop_codon:yes gene_type:complete